MKRLVLFGIVVLFAVACGQDSDTIKERETPGPNTLDGVDISAEAWTASGCTVDESCAGLVETGPCQVAVCDAGECVAADDFPGAPCEGSPGECLRAVCAVDLDGEFGCSGQAPEADGFPCGDFYSECGGTGKCLNGECAGPCDDDNLCTNDTCTSTGCVFTADNTLPCDDGNPCTETDMCNNGECEGTVVCECTKKSDCAVHEDGNLCNGTLLCDEEGYCVVDDATVVDCGKTWNEPCSVINCVVETGECLEETGEDGLACDDGNDCTGDDNCLEGVCSQYEAVLCELACDDGEDEDNDGNADCADPDCYGVGDCPQPVCGDDVCAVTEECAGCPEDCGECVPECGDANLSVDTGEECDDGNLEAGDGCSDICEVEPAPADAGDILITEIMKAPAAVTDSVGEWFEIYNTTNQDIDINAWMLEDAGMDSHRIFVLGGVVAPGNSYLVLGNNDDTETNGGVDVGYVFNAFNLANQDDEVILKSGDTVVDEVAYDDGVTFPDLAGKSLSLDSASMSAEKNDLGENWCDGQDPYGAGDLGTPGADNPECPVCGDSICNATENCGSCDDCACEPDETCLDGVCCNPFCVNMECGDDGCGGECGTCDADFECVEGQCFCVPDCDGKVCGADGCGGECGTCDPGEECIDGACGCAPDCDGKSCGADGCGGDCGTCDPCTICNATGMCLNVGEGYDTKNDCTASDKSTCGLSGNCDGAGACGLWDSATVCEEQYCQDGMVHWQDKCDGAGACNDGGTEGCYPYACDDAGFACRSFCELDEHCSAGFHCTVGNECEID